MTEHGVTASLDELLARQALLRAEYQAAKDRLDAADRAVLEARFADTPRHAEGDVILVKRVLFGQVRWWPGQVAAVHLRYTEGTDANGEPWENKVVSYTVYLKQGNGGFGSLSQGFCHHETRAMPEYTKTRAES